MGGEDGQRSTGGEVGACRRNQEGKVDGCHLKSSPAYGPAALRQQHAWTTCTRAVACVQAAPRRLGSHRHTVPETSVSSPFLSLSSAQAMR